MKSFYLGSASVALRSGVVLAGMLLAGCATTQNFEAPVPQMTPPPPAPPPPVSTLSVGLAVPAAEIARLVNDNTTGRVADVHDQPVKCAIGNCKMTLDAQRTGPITVAAQNNVLYIGVPFKANAYFTLPSILSMLKTEAHVGGRADLIASPTLGANWQVDPHVSGKMTLDNSRIHLGPLDTNLAAIWNDNADLLSKPLFRLINQKLADGMHEGPQVAKLWNSAFAPIRVSENPAAWLVLRPEHIRIGTPSTANNALQLALGLDVRAELVASETAPATQGRPLPAPTPLKSGMNRFSVTLPVVLPYDKASQIALDALIKSPLRVGSHSLNVTKLAIMPSGQDVVVKAAFCITHNWDPADALEGCGVGYLRGVPTFDAATNKIRINSLRYDLLTEDFMMRVMHSLAGPALGQELEKGFVFDLSKDVNKVKDQVRTALAKPQGKDVVISGTVDSFGAPSLIWTKDGFVAAMSASGNVRAEMH